MRRLEKEMEKGNPGVLEKVYETKLDLPWTLTLHEAQKQERMLVERKKQAGSSSKCAVVACYVDDCDLDAEKKLRNLAWKIIRAFFESGDPVETDKFLGLVKVDPPLRKEVYAGALSQQDYLTKLIEEVSSKIDFKS